MEHKKRLLLTCYLPYSPSLVDTLNALAHRLSKSGVRLVFMAVDPDFGPWIDTACADFELLAGGLAAYARPDAYVSVEAESEYAHRLADVDANWGTQADHASLLLSLAGVEACRQAAREAFARHRPVLALLWSAALFPASRVWRDVAREMGVLSFNVERGLLPGTWMLDSEGMYEQSDVLISPPLRKLMKEHSGCARYDQYRAWYATGRPRKYGEAGKGPQALRERLAPKGVVVCAFGGLDTGAYGDGLSVTSRGGALVSSQTMLAALQEMPFDPNATVLFKAHPGSAMRVPPGLYGRVRVLEPHEDPVDLLQMADVVVAGTTSLAYEALLLERPLVQTAEGPLKGLVPLARNAAELGQAIDAAIVKSRDESALEKRRCFLDALLTHYLFAVQPEVPARSLDELAAHLLDLGEGRDLWCGEGAAFLSPTSLASGTRMELLNGSVYFDLGSGFSEQSVHRWAICPEAGVDSCLVPVPSGSISLRFDPADHPCVVRLFEVAWIDSDLKAAYPSRLDELAQNGSEIQFQLRHVGPADFLDLVCTGNDPHFMLPLPSQIVLRLKNAQLHLRLTYSVWRLAAGVALQPEEMFQEIRSSAGVVAASVISAEERHLQRISEVHGALSELQTLQSQGNLLGEESLRQLDARLSGIVGDLRHLVDEVLPLNMHVSGVALGDAEARLVAGQNEVWQRLRRQLDEVAHALLSAQQGLGESLVKGIEAASFRLDEQQLKLHQDTREALVCSIEAVASSLGEMLQRLSQVGAALGACIEERAQEQINAIRGLDLAQADRLQHGLLSLGERQQQNVNQLGLDLAARILEQTQAQVSALQDMDLAQADRLQRGLLSLGEQHQQNVNQLGSALAVRILEQAQAQTNALQNAASTHVEHLKFGLNSLGELYQAHASQMLQGQQKMTDDLLEQLKARQDEKNKLASDLSASTQALASARSKLGILENTLAVRLVRALCRLPKDIFSA